MLFFFEGKYFLFLPEFSTVKPVEFTRDSGFLERDEFLVIFIKGDHILIYMYIFAIVLLLGSVLHCTT